MNAILTALSPGLVALGLSFAVLPWLKRESTLSRAMMCAVTFALLLRYAHWRLTASIPPAGLTLDFLVGVTFAAVEVSALAASALALLFLSRTRERTAEVERNADWPPQHEAPLVDVFICTYNEEETILERTMVGATGMQYPNFRVWVLDDGRRAWLRELAERLGCRYLDRPDNQHAKAGNINHALAHVARLADPPAFVAILDADFVPRPHFVSRALRLMREPDVGIVQTPQHFINPDPIQTNLRLSQVWPDEQRYFFDILMPAKDAWGAAFCCGTSSVIRFEPLMRIGGFPTDSVTEDYLLTLRMKEAGARTVYLNERLTIGLAPEGLKEYITQRSRWCLGLMQIVRGRSGPLSQRSKLDFIDRLSLVDSFMSWAAIYIAKLFGLVVPILFLLFGIRSVQADLSDLLRYFLPFFVWQSITMVWISRGRSLAIMSDVSQYIAAPAVVQAVFAGLLKPQGHKFKVTAKGGDRDTRFLEWPLLRLYLAIFALTLVAIAYSFIVRVSGEGLSYGGLALAWCWYNAFVLAIVCFVCIEQPRRRKSERFATDSPIQLMASGQSSLYRMVDLSISGARIRGKPPVPIGEQVTCAIQGRIADATVVRQMADSFAIRFDEALKSRIEMVRGFYAGEYVTQFDRIDAGRVGRAVIARLFR